MALPTGTQPTCLFSESSLGHWLQRCPTNLDSNYDVPPRPDYRCDICGVYGVHFVTLCPRNSDRGSLTAQRRAADRGRNSENADCATTTMVPHSPENLRARGYSLESDKREGADSSDSVKSNELENLPTNSSDHRRPQYQTADALYSRSRKRAAGPDFEDDLYAKRQEVGRLSYSDGSSSPTQWRQGHRVRPRTQRSQELFPERVGHAERQFGLEAREEHGDNGNDSVKMRRDDSMQDLSEDDLWVKKSSHSKSCLTAELEVKLAREEADRFLEAFAIELFNEQAKLRLELRPKA